MIAEQRTPEPGARHRRMHNNHWMNMTRRAQRGIPETEEGIHFDIFTYEFNNRD